MQKLTFQDNTQKRESGFCLENATMIQIQDMLGNGAPENGQGF